MFNLLILNFLFFTHTKPSKIEIRMTAFKNVARASALSLLASVPVGLIYLIAVARISEPLPEAMGIAAFILCGVVGVLLGARIASQAAPQRSGTASPHRSRSRPEAAPIPIGEREQGAVKWFNASKGFGFISRDSGGDVFVHFRSIRGTGHRALREAQRVEFNIADGDKGLQAIEVEVL